jgi:hypothetical protein
MAGVRSDTLQTCFVSRGPGLLGAGGTDGTLSRSQPGRTRTLASAPVPELLGSDADGYQSRSLTYGRRRESYSASVIVIKLP